MRRALRTITAVAAIAGLVAACSGDDDDDGTTVDLATIEADYGAVESVGGVLGVSVQGRVLRAGREGEWCVAQLDGASETCWPVDQRVEPGTVQWSPDGSKVAFDGRVERAQAFDSDVRVLDLDTGEIVTVADDGSDDAAGPQDLLPAWVDDDELAFLRDGGESLQVVFTEARGLDGDVETADIDSLELADIASPTALALDDRYTIPVRGDPFNLAEVDDAGEVRPILELAAQDARVGGTSRDTERAVVASGVDGDGITPVIFLGEDDVATEGSFTSTAVTVSPDGRLVAAAVFDEPGITIWDPTGDEPRSFEPGGGPTVENPLGLVWTDDDELVTWSPTSWQVVTLTGD